MTGNMGLIDHPLSPLIVAWLEAVQRRASVFNALTHLAEVRARNALNAALSNEMRLRHKLEEIHDITQDTTLEASGFRIPCWQKLQNIEATAASALNAALEESK